MERLISGAALMFLGSGCGPALSDEQRSVLAQAKPEEFYPIEHLLEMYAAAAESGGDLLYATGRRWGAALKEDLVRRGASGVKRALELTQDIYQEHQRGDVGALLVDLEGEHSARITNTGPHPTRLVAGVYQAVATTFSEVDAEFSISDNVVRLSWAPEGSR